jgi:uncharacterized membrane protein YeaQ/YmgE (transglycosylase-associated protein family)
MGLCGWIGFLIWGFFAGLIARALMPGEQRMGLLKTTLLGIGGSFAGNFLAAILLGRNPMILRPSGFIGAVIGAMVLLALGQLLSRKL